jgi:hypothetical protein
MSETVTSSPAPVAAPAAPARTAKTLAEATRNAMSSDYVPSSESGDSASAAPSSSTDPMSQIAAAAALTEAAARGDNPPAVDQEGLAAEVVSEEVKAETAKPDFGLVKHFRAKADSETQARMRAEAEVGMLRDQLQQVVDYLQKQQAQQSAPVELAAPEYAEDDYGDPALQQLAVMRREMAEFKALKAELDNIKNERESEKLSAKATVIETGLRKDWDAAKSKYSVLSNREHAGKLWDMIKANPGLEVEDAAIILQHRFGESRTGPVSRASQAPPALVAAPPRQAPPRPPPGGTAAMVAPPAKIRTLEDAKRAAMAMR